MIPFRLTFRPGVSFHDQVVYAAKRAIISGQMRPGDPFPSVRTLSRELKVNPNTAHKVVAQLTAEGLLDVRLGIGTVVSELGPSTVAERSRLLKIELEELVVEAKKLNMNLDEFLAAVAGHWQRLSSGGGAQ